MNRNFGKVEGGAMTFARNYLRMRYSETFVTVDDDGTEREDTVERTGPFVVNPTAEQYRAMGYLPNDWTEPAVPDGMRVRSYSWVTDGETNTRVFEFEPDSPRPVNISKSKVERAIDSMGKTADFQAWLYSKAQYVGDWLRGGDTIVYDPTDNASDLVSMMAALGFTADQMPALIASVLAEEA